MNEMKLIFISDSFRNLRMKKGKSKIFLGLHLKAKQIKVRKIDSCNVLWLWLWFKKGVFIEWSNTNHVISIYSPARPKEGSAECKNIENWRKRNSVQREIPKTERISFPFRSSAHWRIYLFFTWVDTKDTHRLKIQGKGPFSKTLGRGSMI